MIKKLIFSLCITMIFTNILYAQKNAKNILNSTDIIEIEEYLKNAHPDDPKRIILKSKLVTLKNEVWTKGKYNAKPVVVRPETIQKESNLYTSSNVDEGKEFAQLMTFISQEHKDKTVNLLNALFTQDINSKDVILLLKNQSNCNIILRIHGKDNYNLPVPAHSENFMTINKGSYHFTSKVCRASYSSQKNIVKGTILSIGI